MKITAMPEIPQGNLTATNQPDINESLKAPEPKVSIPETKEELLSQKYADWARKEKAHRVKIQAERDALKKAQEEFEARKTEYERDYVRKSQIPEYFQRGNLKDLGLTGDQVTQALLNQPSPQDLKIQELEAKLSALTGQLDQTKNLFGERDNQAMQQALKQILTDVKTTISKDPAYEIISSTGSEEDVVNLIKENFDKTGVLMTVEEAAQSIEKSLEEELVKYAQLKKVQERLKPAPAVVPGAAKPNTPAVKTLANAQVPGARPPMSPRDRAVAMLEGRI